MIAASDVATPSSASSGSAGRSARARRLIAENVPRARGFLDSRRLIRDQHVTNPLGGPVLVGLRRKHRIPNPQRVQLLLAGAA